MRPLRILTLILCAASSDPASAVQPLRFIAAGFEADDPQRDCAVDATTESALAERLRAPDVASVCIPPFTVGQLEVCVGTSTACGNGCVVPIGPTATATVDAVQGRIVLQDPGGQVLARIRGPVTPECTAGFAFDALSLTLDYVGLPDGLDGVLLAGLAAAPDATTSGPFPVSGCPGLGAEIAQIAGALQARVLQAYRETTLTRIGEPLDAAVCPIVRP
jgi:hypothetical protein